MERKIVRHAVGATAHDAALDAEFHQGQRVVTIDGYAGRIVFVSPSFSPGVTEYQVTLDNGMGGGTYIGSQLRAVPDSYRAPAGPVNHLPAGVTAAIDTVAGEIHVASDDYPEMGSILHDRPDPAGQFRVIGRRSEYEAIEPVADVPLRALRPTAGLIIQADAYAQGYDARDDDENGGEADTGMYWETPANQQWRDENLGEPPEPTIEDPGDVPGVGPEQFEQQFGKISTTINGQQIDGHGDAPEHGTRPRAANANAYDAESTEGHEGQDTDKALDGVNEDAERASTTGMFPAGVFAGDGFGSMGFGASRVPWTSHERTELHSWDNGQGASAGDFVPSGDFTNARRPAKQELEELAPDVIAQQLQAQASVHDVDCYYQHNGPCHEPDDGPISVHGESVGHSRPRGYDSWVTPLSESEQEHQEQRTGTRSTHVLMGSVNGRIAGKLHFQEHPDGRAIKVGMLHSYKEHGGVGSAMMDDLYSRAHQNGAWINHGVRTDDGKSWWSRYSEPHPELNAHNTPHDQPMAATHQHPAGRPWGHYWDHETVKDDRAMNEGRRDLADEFQHDPGWGDAKADAAHDMGDHDHGFFGDPYHGWGDLLETHHEPHREHSEVPAHRGGWEDYMPQHARTGAAHNPDHHYELHLANDHGYTANDIDRIRQHGLHDMHGALHQTGLANHQHGDLGSELAAGWRHHEQQQTADRFGLRPTRQYLKSQTGPQRGGSAGHMPDETREARPQLPDDPAKLNAYWSSLHAQAGSVRVRQHGPDDYEFTFGGHDDEDPANSLDEGGDDEAAGKLDTEQEQDGLESGEPELNTPERSGTAENATEQPGPDESAPGAEEAGPPGNLPAGVTPPAQPSSPSKRPPLVPQSGAGDHPESWPLATAPVQETPLPLSEGRTPSRTTQRMKGVNPAQIQLPGAGDGAEIDGEKPGSGKEGDSKPPSKEAALAAFTAAARSESFRFEFTASWRDVVAKAKRLRKAGRVRITHASRGMVIGAVGGDHDVYECGIQRPPGSPQTIQHWACGCPWASFHQDSSYSGRLNGRPCSHVYALQLEAASRSAHGRELTRDPGADELGLTHQVVVKSMPPWGPGGWSQTWLAPAASLRAVIAARQLVATGEDPADVELLARSAGIDLTAAANDPWGDNNYTEKEMPPGKPLGATEPPNKAMDPGSYGRLSGPDPEDWGDIEIGGLGQPFSHEAVLPGLEGGDAVIDTPDSAVPYPARTNTAGPSTALDPRDPGGIRMEEALDPEAEGAEFERHMIEEHGQDPSNVSRWHHEHHINDHDDAIRAREAGEPPETHWDGWQSHPYHTTAWEQRQGTGQWPDAGGTHSFVAAERRELPDKEPLGEYHHGQECTCATCEYNRYHAKHAAQIALQAGLAALEAGAVEDAERARRQIGVDGTAGDAQDVPHAFSGNTPYCSACSLSADADVHHRDGAQAELHSRPEPALPETTADLASPGSVSGGDPLDAATTGGGPGMSGGDESLSPSDTSIQTIGAENFGGDDEIADEGFSTSSQESGPEQYSDDPIAQFQATAAARQYAGGGQPAGDGDIAAAAREFLSKTADVLPEHEAAALIAEGRGGDRARNLDMLKLEGTHYEGMDEEMAHRGLSLDHYDDDLVVI